MPNASDTDKLCTNYLQNYAEPELTWLADIIKTRQEHFEQALLLPAFNEPNDFLQQVFKQIPASPKRLIILVINAPLAKTPTASSQKQSFEQQAGADQQALTQTRRLLEYFLTAGELIAQSGPLYRLNYRGFCCLLVDRCSPGRLIPSKQGVGLARKIAGDLAIALIHSGHVDSPWVFSTDADVELPTEYFSAADQLNSNSSAFLLPFFHDCSQASQLQLATQLHEYALDYYVAGLHWAQSAYAYCPLGSILGFHYLAYVQARGFPKKSAGEDFYLLNKLAKLGKVQQLQQPRIKIQARLSNRVPFGTGPTVKRIESLSRPQAQYLYYHPYCFYGIKALLATMANHQPARFDRFFPSLAERSEALVQSHPLQLDGTKPQTELAQAIEQCLQIMGFSDFLQHCRRQAKQERQLQEQHRIWFDGFRSLKLIHGLREQFYPSIRLDQLLSSQAPFLPSPPAALVEQPVKGN